MDLLRQFDIPLSRFTVEATARMLAGKNFWQQLWYHWQIRKATNFLIHAERILKPRDGQIEAKGRQVEAGEYILRFTKLILQMADKHQEIQLSLLSFGWKLIDLKREQQALRCFNKALTFTSDASSIYFYKGIALDNLGRFEDAIASYEKAIEFKGDKHEAWYNKGIALGNLGRFEDAIASYEKAIEFKGDDHEAWYNKGIALGNLGRFEDAIASYEKAIEFKGDKHEAWYNKARCYALQGNVELAIENLRQAINLNPDECREWAKTDSDFDSIREDGRFQTLIINS